METEKKSFIRDMCRTLRAQVSQETWIEFESEENSRKVSFLVRRLSVLDRIDECIEGELKKYENKDGSNASIQEIQSCWNFRKCKLKSLQFKAAGNHAFGSGDNETALDLYSYAIAFMDPSETTNLSILYANRSAALFHLGEYKLSQRDIESSVELGYPAELQYKLYERSGRCFAQERKNTEAARRFQQALNALSHPLVNLNVEKKDKLKLGLEKLLKASTKSGFGFVCNSTTGNDASKGKSSALPATVGGKGNYLKNASLKLSLLKSEKEGRYIVANENILPGEIIVVEKAYISTLTQEAYHQQCFQCFSMLRAPVPCRNCALVSFCSLKCRDSAWSTHHQHECSILGILRLAGVSITCLMSLRAVTQSRLPEILKWVSLIPKEEADDPPSSKAKQGNWRDNQFQFKDQYDPSHITSVLKLVTHSNDRNSEDYFHRIIMALFLVSLLQRTGFFVSSVFVKEEAAGSSQPENGCTNDPIEVAAKGSGNGSNGPSRLPSEQVICLGAILLRILQTLQFNAHEIAGWDPSVSKSTFIGGGLFPTLALFNHSCNPAIVRYYINDTVIVRTVRTIQRGEPVTENYGPIFTQSPRHERLAYLKSRYWFDCSCVACIDDWPLFKDLSKDDIRFRCSNCRAYLCSTNTETFNLLLRCARCLKPTNMLQSLKSLEKSEGKFNQATEFLKAGKLDTAAGILLENMTLFDSVLLPPFQDYHWCQEGLRKCYLPLGNQSNSFKIRSLDSKETGAIVVAEQRS